MISELGEFKNVFVELKLILVITVLPSILLTQKTNYITRVG